jgi:hypothetical protein
LGALGGGVAGATAGLAGGGASAVPGGIGGAILGGEAGKQGEIAANNAIFGDNESSLSPYTSGNLTDTATRVAGDAMAGFPEAKGTEMVVNEAKNLAARKEAQSVGDQITEQLTAKEALKKNARKVVDLATQATDDAVTLNPHEDLNSFINTLRPAAKEEFLNEVMPKLTAIGKSIVGEGGKLAEATPVDALKYRDAAYTAMKANPELETYADRVYDAFTKTIQRAMKDGGYKGFTAADNQIEAGNPIIEAASSLGKKAAPYVDDVVSATAQAVNGKTNFQTTSIPTKGAPDVEDTEPAPTSTKIGNLMKTAINNKYTKAAGMGAAFAAGRAPVQHISNMIMKSMFPD